MQAAWVLETPLCPPASPSDEEWQFRLPTAGLGGKGSTTAAVFSSWLCSTFPWKGSWNSEPCSSSHAVPLLTSLRTRRRRITLSYM